MQSRAGRPGRTLLTLLQEKKSFDDFLSSMEGACTSLDDLVTAARSRSEELVEKGPKQCKLLIMEAYLLLAHRAVARAADGDTRDAAVGELKRLCLQEQMFCVNNALQVSIGDLHAAVQPLLQNNIS